MATNNRRRQPGGIDPQTIILGVIIAVIVLAAALVHVGVHLGHRLAGRERPDTGPWETLFGVLSGEVPWLGQSTAVAVAAVVLSLLVAGAGIAVVRRRRRRRSRVDDSSRYLGRGRDIEALSRESVAATAKRLCVDAPLPGMRLGRTIGSRGEVWSSWEDVLVLIAGPRTQKTTCYVIPSVLEAPGAVVVTSNKRDVVDATRDVRARSGPVWVFDPQDVVGEPQTWWWNPLDYVVDEVAAVKLAELFMGATRSSDSRGDAYFDGDAKTLIAWLLLAAARDDRPITDVYRWVTQPGNSEASTILTRAGHPLQADELTAMANYTDKQRSGVYGGAKQMVGFLTNSRATRWVTPPAQGSSTRLDVDELVRSKGTLYSLSREGGGTAGPLVTALTVALTEAGERLATESPAGRLPVPMTIVLDEAANVCRWRELPNLYSHYGSRGIWILTVLQSWSQGVEVWGEAGMKKLWSAANVKVYGGGVSERQFLEDLSALLGSYDRRTGSVSINQGSGRGRSVSHQLTREKILDVDDLGALPKGRAIVIASGSRPTMIRTQPWMAGPRAAEVKASITAHDPQGSQTVREAEHSATVVEAEEDQRERVGG